MLNVPFEKYHELIDGKTVLITGGTGTLGKKLSEIILSKFNAKKLIILSRDEMKQWNMQNELIKYSEKIRFFIGDVRDRDRLYRAFQGVDIVIHAAATKIVPIAEYNPFECIKTNVNGAMNVVDAALDCNVSSVIALSTDKASSPINLYGASKLASDKLFVAANGYSGTNKTKFSVVRYGNVMGSRGSVIPLYLSLKGKEPLPVTDKRMTRFMISIEQGIELIFMALRDMIGGEIFVRKIPSMNLTDIASTIDASNFTEIGIRPGEKIHEQMIGSEDAPFTYEYPDYYKILPQIHDWSEDERRIMNGKKVANDFSYTSNNNTDWMSKADLQNWIRYTYNDEV